ncbi:MAG: hypothetical protein M0P17_00300 [Methanoculleus sp.]|nr:hypothetical protein [Methanoculleus sp.]
MDSIRTATGVVGNCASSRLQGIEYYRGRGEDTATGLVHWNLGGYRPSDIEVAAAFDINARKVRKDVSEAIFSLRTAPRLSCPGVLKTGVTVR